MKLTINRKLMDFFRKYGIAVSVVLFFSFIIGIYYGDEVNSVLFKEYSIQTMSTFSGGAIGISLGAILMIVALVMILIPRKAEDRLSTGAIATRKLSLTGIALTLVVILLLIGGGLVGLSTLYLFLEDIFGKFTNYVVIAISLIIVYKMFKK